MEVSMTIPSHVPPERVVDFDRFSGPELARCPHQQVSALFKTSPDLFFTPHDRGHWVVASAEVARDMLRQPDKFSSHPRHNKANQRNPRTLPNQSDPPEHTDLRRIVNPYFSPAGVQRMEPVIRALARELIAAVRENGTCEFVAEIARIFPVVVFLQMAGAPLEDRERLSAMADRFTRSPDVKDRLAALEDLAAYLRTLIAAREQQPADDLVSLVVHARVGERPLDDDEKIGMVTLLFLGGLDTVVATLSFIMLFLADHPDHYRQLCDEPSRLPGAIEELMRVHGVAGTERGVTHDMHYAGVDFKAGDRLVFPAHVYGICNLTTADPLRVDFSRPVSNHLVFGAGPHRCLGSNLARLELRIFLEEWIAQMPVFHRTSEGDVETRGGLVWSPVRVDLGWPLAAANP
jgi:cytochrome P450